MGGYDDCKYYDKLEVLVDLLCNGQITQEVFDERHLEYAEFELYCHNDWFASHFNSTAEYLCENEPDEIGRPFDEMVAMAEKEIALFRKHGYNGHADSMERMLKKAKDYAMA